MKRLPSWLVFGSMVIALAGCGDDKKKRAVDGGLLADGGDDGDDRDDDGEETLPSIDASIGRDGGLDASADGSVLLPDGALADGGDAGRSPDGAVVGDASLDAGGCDVNDPRFGCGRVGPSGTWVRFESGLEVDRTTGLAWSPSREGETDEQLDSYCKELALAGLTFRLPEIREVRSLAAGCPQTLADSATCTVQEGEEQRASSGCGGCEPARGPHASGGYCRPEVPDCDALWTLTYCGPNGTDCPVHEHWFYIPSTGAVELHGYGTPVALSAKGRCVARAPDPLP